MADDKVDSRQAAFDKRAEDQSEAVGDLMKSCGFWYLALLFGPGIVQPIAGVMLPLRLFGLGLYAISAQPEYGRPDAPLCGSAEQ